VRVEAGRLYTTIRQQAKNTAENVTQTTTAKHYTTTPENVEFLAGYRVVVYIEIQRGFLMLRGFPWDMARDYT